MKNPFTKLSFFAKKPIAKANHPKILQAIKHHNISNENYNLRLKQQAEERDIGEMYFAEFKLNHLISASVDDYIVFLEKWLVNNDITHYYDYNFPNDTYVATSNFVLDHGFYGATSFNIIVPSGIEFEIKKLGHCNIYDMDKVECIGAFVPSYKNIFIKN